MLLVLWICVASVWWTAVPGSHPPPPFGSRFSSWQIGSLQPFMRVTCCIATFARASPFKVCNQDKFWVIREQNVTWFVTVRVTLAPSAPTYIDKVSYRPLLRTYSKWIFFNIYILKVWLFFSEQLDIYSFTLVNEHSHLWSGLMMTKALSTTSLPEVSIPDNLVPNKTDEGVVELRRSWCSKRLIRLDLYGRGRGTAQVNSPWALPHVERPWLLKALRRMWGK